MEKSWGWRGEWHFDLEDMEERYCSPKVLSIGHGLSIILCKHNSSLQATHFSLLLALPSNRFLRFVSRTVEAQVLFSVCINWQHLSSGWKNSLNNIDIT